MSKSPYLEAALKGLQLTMAQFVDLCILLGCDYTKKISGIGPVKALQFIRQYGSLEGVIKNIDKTKYTIPENFDIEKVRKMFLQPEVLDPSTLDLKWEDSNEEGIIQFLVIEKGFSEERVRNGISKLKKQRSTSVQERLTSYFGVPIVSSPKKRKTEDVNGKNSKKSKTGKKNVKSPAKKKK